MNNLTKPLQRIGGIVPEKIKYNITELPGGEIAENLPQEGYTLGQAVTISIGIVFGFTAAVCACRVVGLITRDWIRRRFFRDNDRPEENDPLVEEVRYNVALEEIRLPIETEETSD